VVLKFAKMHWRPRLCPGPARRAHNAPPDSLVDWVGDTPSPHPTPLVPRFSCLRCSFDGPLARPRPQPFHSSKCSGAVDKWSKKTRGTG